MLNTIGPAVFPRAEVECIPFKGSKHIADYMGVDKAFDPITSFKVWVVGIVVSVIALILTVAHSRHFLFNQHNRDHHVFFQRHRLGSHFYC